MKPFKITLAFEPLKGLTGFRSEWISGKCEGTGKCESTEVGFDSGAGLGSPMLTFWRKKNGGETKYYAANMLTALQKAMELTEEK